MKYFSICFVLIAIISGCTTVPVTPDIAIQVPQNRLVNQEFSLPDSIRDLKVTFIRDSGLIGGGCYIVLSMNKKIIAKLEVSEKVSIYLKEGNYIFGVTGGDDGLCSTWPFYEHNVIVSKDRKNHYRIMTDRNGVVWILPVSN